MPLSRKPLSSQRLAEVSDAILLACLETRKHTQALQNQDSQQKDGQKQDSLRSPGEVPSVTPLEMRAPNRPAGMEKFTQAEIDEACRFLARLGVLERTPRRSAA